MPNQTVSYSNGVITLTKRNGSQQLMTFDGASSFERDGSFTPVLLNGDDGQPISFGGAMNPVYWQVRGDLITFVLAQDEITLLQSVSQIVIAIPDGIIDDIDPAMAANGFGGFCWGVVATGPVVEPWDIFAFTKQAGDYGDQPFLRLYRSIKANLGSPVALQSLGVASQAFPDNDGIRYEATVTARIV